MTADRMAKIDVEDLISLVRNYNPKTNEKLIRDAYTYGEAMHEGQFRRSGEPYFTHPVAVAAILTEQRLDDATIVTALLHDTIEDTKASYSEVEQRFGYEVADQPAAFVVRDQTGREFPQAVHGHVQGPAGDPGEAR